MKGLFTLSINKRSLTNSLTTKINSKSTIILLGYLNKRNFSDKQIKSSANKKNKSNQANHNKKDKKQEKDLYYLWEDSKSIKKSEFYMHNELEYKDNNSKFVLKKNDRVKRVIVKEFSDDEDLEMSQEIILDTQDDHKFNLVSNEYKVNDVIDNNDIKKNTPNEETWDSDSVNKLKTTAFESSTTSQIKNNKNSIINTDTNSIRKKDCYGCGITLQSNDPYRIGYVPESKLIDSKDDDLICERCYKLKYYGTFEDKAKDKKHLKERKLSKEDRFKLKVKEILNKNEQEIIINKNLQESRIKQKLEKIGEEDGDIEEEEDIMNDILKEDNDILPSSQDSAENMLDNRESLKIKKQKIKALIKQDNIPLKLKAYSIINEIPASKIITSIENRLSKYSQVIYILDITDIENSINYEFISVLQKKECGVIFIINKFDLLPEGSSYERINIYVGTKLKSLLKQYNINYSYIVLSAKTGFKYQYILSKLKQMRKYYKEHEVYHGYPKIYITGNCNVGKSSFINMISKKTSNMVMDKIEKNNLLNSSKKTKTSSTEMGFLFKDGNRLNRKDRKAQGKEIKILEKELAEEESNNRQYDLQDIREDVISNSKNNDMDNINEVVNREKEEKYREALLDNLKSGDVFYDPSMIGINLEGNSIMDDEVYEKLKEMKAQKEGKSGNSGIKDKNELSKSVKELTTSPIPGTTLDIKKINIIHYGCRFFDTPGFPNKSSMLSKFIYDIDGLFSINFKSKISPHLFNLKQNNTVFIGALARIDLLNGEDKIFSAFFPENVTIHRTPTIKADEVYETKKGIILRPFIKPELNDIYNNEKIEQSNSSDAMSNSTQFTKHIFDLNCTQYRFLEFDVVISGLGWFSLSGKGYCQIEVYAPIGIKVSLRTPALLPYEVRNIGSQKLHGKTINLDSKRNKGYKEAYLKLKNDENKNI